MYTNKSISTNTKLCQTADVRELLSIMGGMILRHLPAGESGEGGPTNS